MSIPVGIKIHTVPYTCSAAPLSSYPGRGFLWAYVSGGLNQLASGRRLFRGLFGLSCLFGWTKLTDKPNQPDQQNKPDKPDRLACAPLVLAPQSCASPALTRNESVKRIEGKNESLCIFLIDIKLALGNNPHLFSILFWSFHVAYDIRHQYFGAQR
jgi:hypothetical protein